MWWKRHGRGVPVPETPDLRMVPPGSEPVDYWHSMADDTKIVFMWDKGITVPLWAEDGHLSEDPEWLSGELGLSDALIADLIRWGQDMHVVYDYDHTSRELSPAEDALWERSTDLIARLRSELAGRFDVIVGPGEFDAAGD